MKRVYLSADDFGRSKERNRAIDESFKSGLIKSAGLIVTGQYLPDAVKLINEGGYVRHIHCHFNLSGNLKGEDSMDRPITEKMKKDKMFCDNGLFRSYSGLPSNLSSIVKSFVVYKELVAQFNKFVEVTNGEGNLRHIDFHLWYNLTLPVSIALNLFTWTHRIKSVRYIGVNKEHSKRRFIRLLSWNPFIKSFRSSNIDGFLSKPEWFEKDKTIELYCHPDYMNGNLDILMDNSISYFGHKKKTLLEHIDMLKQYDIEFVSWGQ